MLINLRNALMAGKRLPYDAEVEYLESTGTQWIDTGCTLNTDTDVLRIVYQNTSTQTHKWLWGSYEANAKVGCSSATVSAPTVWYKGGISMAKDAQYNSPHTLIFDANGASNDGVALSSFKSIVGTYNLYLYALNLDNLSAPSSYFGYGRIYGYQHRRNGVLIRDLIPVRKGQVGYLFDRVSGLMKPFGNAGTGDFVLGPDVVPVEYIESHGTEYIDTGVTQEIDTSFAVDASINNLTSGRFGCYGTGGSGVGMRFCFGVVNSKWACGLNTAAYNHSIANADSLRHQFVLFGSDFSVDGSIVYQSIPPLTPTQNNIYIFAEHDSDGASFRATARLFRCEIWRNTIPVRSFRPVRVGSGSTWEGAMMDVLTRRIYRNAGSGAFTYGNDLKYPIPAA